MKLTFKKNKIGESAVYTTDGKEVRCILQCSLNLEKNYPFIRFDKKFIKKLVNRLNIKYKLGSHEGFTVVGIARCDESDSFNEVTGKRVAESKAKIKAYSIAQCIIDNITELLDYTAENNSLFQTQMFELRYNERTHLGILSGIN